jgi:putative FmdB family regulatory protein
MPIYEYRRPDGTTFELQQSFSDESLTVDPDTGVPVERVLHAPAVHFKGKGFYNTDYGTRNRQRETAAAAEKSSSEKKSSSPEKSSGEKSSSEGSASSSSSSSSTPSDGKAGKGGAKSGESKPVAAK